MTTAQKICSWGDAQALLNCRRLPARLTTSQTAVLLGFQEHDIAPLVAVKLLQPLGKPAPNAPKYFAAVEVEGLVLNRDWLSHATKALAKHWLGKNHRKKGDVHGVTLEAELQAA